MSNARKLEAITGLRSRMTLTCRRSLPCSSASAVQSFCEYHLEGKSGASRCDFFCVLFRTTSLRSVAPFVLMIPRLFGAWSFCLYSINTQINYYFFTRKCGKTQKHLKTPWPGVFNRGVFRACLANFHTNMWRTRTKAAENRPCAAKCGGTWKNPHQKATFLHENVAKHTKAAEN